jgi:nucleotide-binding universal stress UspA family protein
VVTKGETQEEIERNIDHAKRTMAEAKERVNASVRTFVRVGDPVQAINLLAEEEDVSLIVMGAHTRGILWELFHGSTIYDLTTRTKRPVLVVKHHPS